MDETNHALEGFVNPDPSPSPVTIARDRATTLVGNLTTPALDELRKLRDDAEALSAVLQKNHHLLLTAIDEHAQKVSAVIESKAIMAEQMTKLTELFAPVVPVLTQLNGGGRE